MSVTGDQSQRSHISALNSDEIIFLAEQGSVSACREHMRREIMRVDGVPYVETTQTLLAMNGFVRGEADRLKMPYILAIYAAYLSGWLSLPLVFHYPTARAFNDAFVTAEPPAVGDADTWLEVGNWAWGWMEPLTGGPSFFLLCLQFARDARLSIGGSEATGRMQDFQGGRLSSAFPAYAESVVQGYGRALAMRCDAAALVSEHERICQLEVQQLREQLREDDKHA